MEFNSIDFQQEQMPDAEELLKNMLANEDLI